MSLFNSFKRALGFPDEFDDLEEDYSDLEDNDLEVEEIIAEQAATVNMPDESAAGDDVLISEIVDGIIQCDNENEATRRSALNDLVSRMLNAYRSRCQDIEEAHWNDHLTAVNKENSQLKSEIERNDKKLKEFEMASLSTTRQKRAMNERLSEMERQISSLEAEREQLQLENRYMINKLRGSSMPVVNAAGPLAEELKRLNEETQAQKKELNHVKLQLAEAEKRLRQSNAGDTITPEQLLEVEEKLKEFEKIKNNKEVRIKSLSEKVKDLEQENTNLAERLNAELSKSRDLSEQVRQLNDTVAQNLKDNAAFCDELREENRRLTSMINSGDTPGKKTISHSRAKTSAKDKSLKISAIDELMESTDWFEATPPGPRIKDPEVLENFGYKETPKKPSKKTNDNQLTLF